MKRFVLSIAISIICGITFAADTVLVRMKTQDGKISYKTLQLENIDNFQRAHISSSDIPSNIDSVEIFPSFAKSKIDDDGYYIMPDGMYGKFSKREKDASYSIRHMPLALSGMKKGNTAFAP